MVLKTVGSRSLSVFKLEGSSMMPLFKEGDIAFVAPAVHPSSSVPRPGDCVVYEIEGRKLLHRVVRTEPAGVWISDDAGCIAPHFISWALIEGKVLSGNPFKQGRPGLWYSVIRRFLRRVSGHVKTPCP